MYLIPITGGVGVSLRMRSCARCSGELEDVGEVLRWRVQIKHNGVLDHLARPGVGRVLFWPSMKMQHSGISASRRG
jgi:hypothetical protein